MHHNIKTNTIHLVTDFSATFWAFFLSPYTAVLSTALNNIESTIPTGIGVSVWRPVRSWNVCKTVAIHAGLDRQRQGEPGACGRRETLGSETKYKSRELWRPWALAGSPQVKVLIAAVRGRAPSSQPVNTTWRRRATARWRVLIHRVHLARARLWKEPSQGHSR